MDSNEIIVLGVKVRDITVSETAELIEKFVEERNKPHLIVTLGTEMVIAAQKDSSIKDLINNASLVCADGVGVIWGAKKAGLKIREKAAGVEILEEVVKKSSESKLKIFLLGAKPGTAEKAKENLKKKYPNCNIVGTFHGYFKEDSEPIEIIKKAKPDVIFTALGFPKQEKWYLSHAQELDIPVGIGVGGSFDVLSGNIERAPMWMRKLSLEWLYRLIKEPSRLGRMMSIPKFIFAVLFSKNGKKK